MIVITLHKIAHSKAKLQLASERLQQAGYKCLITGGENQETQWKPDKPPAKPLNKVFTQRELDGMKSRGVYVREE
ncbi:MAG: hypothetical protein ABIH21_05000 [Patescibacteria group bacterium]